VVEIDTLAFIYVPLGIAAVVALLIMSHIRRRGDLERGLRDSFGKQPKEAKHLPNGVETYRLYRAKNSDTARHIDGITWDDLDMDLVFGRINTCQTSVGEEYLYNCLHEPHFDQSHLLAREAFISTLKQNPEARLKIQMCLAGAGKLDFNGMADMIYHSRERLLKFPLVYTVLSVVPVLCLLAIFAGFQVGIFCLLGSSLANAAVYLITKRKIENSFSTIKYFSSLLWCCGKLCKMENLKAEPYIIQLRRLFFVFKPLMSKGAAISQNFSDGFLGIIYEYLQMLFLAGVRRYNRVISGIAKNTGEFHELYKTLGEIDLAVCVLSFRESLPFSSTPVFHGENTIIFEDVYHPLLLAPVTNSGTIKNNSIITGSNASGKSTFIKSLAVNGILAQTIFSCAAKGFSTGFALVMSSMAVRDSISEGESYFVTEIKSLKRILEKIKTVRCACYIDEILRGTNTTERIAASAAVLSFLEGKNCLCVAASHDLELARMLQGKLDNYHFREQLTDDGMVFDYKLRQGISNTKNAIRLLRYMDFDGAIIEHAESLADK